MIDIKRVLATSLVAFTLSCVAACSSSDGTSASTTTSVVTTSAASSTSSSTGAGGGSSVDASSAEASSSSTGVTTELVLESPDFEPGKEMPVDASCTGAGKSPALAWTGAPDGTAEFALLMTTLAKDGLKYNWVLHGIPAATTSLPNGSTAIGTAGLTSNGPQLAYAPPCSPGPGTKIYTFTLYALSGKPTLPADPKQVTGPVVAKAIESLTLAKASLDGAHTTTP